MIRPHDSIIVQRISWLLVPLIQIYALYVLVHGHESPGGGFQAGILFGASLILAVLARGTGPDQLDKEKMAVRVGAAGLCLYLGIGLVGLLMGGEFLDYSLLPLPGVESSMRRYYGILGIEIGVCLGVAAMIVSIFFDLALQEEE